MILKGAGPVDMQMSEPQGGWAATVIAVAMGRICNIIDRFWQSQNLDPMDLKEKMTTKWMG